MAMAMEETDWWEDVMKGIYGPRKGGARIIVDAEDAETGVGKTGLAIGIAQYLAEVFGYDLKREDITLSGQEYLERWREHPDKEQPSVLILDELSGAGAGDARRSMSNQNVNLGRSWQLMRKKRVVTITTLPHWSDADKKMRRFADFRLWCRNQPIGYFVPFRVGASFEAGDVMTYGYDDIQNGIRFPNLDRHDDELYEYAAELKDDLLESEYFDADALAEGGEAEQPDPEEAVREFKIERAQDLRNDGKSTREVAEIVDMSKTWVIDNTQQPSNNQGVHADD